MQPLSIESMVGCKAKRVPRERRAPARHGYARRPGWSPALPGARNAKRGFTLLEVLLSIALIALVGGVLVGGAAHLMSDQPLTSHDVFWQAVREARKAALKSEHDVRLKFDKDKKQFLLIDGMAPATLAPDGFTRQETPLKQIPIPMAAGTDLTVEFLGPATKGGGSAILVGGVMIESQTVPYVTFYSDGTCSPFRTQFVRGGSSSVLSIDPWTCAPVLTPNDPNAPPSS